MKFFCTTFSCGLSFSLLCQTYYVEVSGSNMSTDIQNPGDLSYTFDNAPSGSIIYVKAGNYGALNLTGCNDSVQFIGYTSVPEDISASDVPNYQTFDMPTIETTFPLLDGGDQATGGTAVELNGEHIVFKNFYVRNYNHGITSVGNHNLIENCVAHDFGNPQSSYNGTGYNYYGDHHVIRNCFLLNAGAQGITTKGDYNLIDNCQVYSDDSTAYAPTDYYILITTNSNTRRAMYNTVQNCHVERVGNLAHSGHGLCITTFYIHEACQTGGGYCYDTQYENDSVFYNLIENSTSVNIGEPVLLRGPGVQQNELNYITSESYGALTITTGASFNHFNNCHVKDTYYYKNPNSSSIGFNAGIEFYAHGWGDTTDQNVPYSAQGTYPWELNVCAEGNTFTNCLLEDLSAALMYSSYSEFQDHLGNPVDRENRKIVKDNQFINCTFVGKPDSNDVFIYAMRGNEGNEFINCIINGFETWESRYFPTSQSQAVLDNHSIIPSNNTYNHCNFFNNNFDIDIIENGTLNGPTSFVTTGFQDSVKGVFIECNTLDPGFVDAVNNDFSLNNCTGCGTVDKGLSQSEMNGIGFGNLTIDLVNNMRPCGAYFDIGAYEFDNCSSQNISEIEIEINIFPNPVLDQIIIESNDNGTMSLYTLQGKLVQVSNLIDGKNIITAPANSGVYVVSISLSSGQTYQTKLIKM